MERFLALLAFVIAAVGVPSQVSAQEFTTSRTIATERWVEEWDPASQRWVRVDDSPDDASAMGPVASVETTHIINGVVVEYTHTAVIAATSAGLAPPKLDAQFGSNQEFGAAQYGPFRVLDNERAALVGATDQMSPAYFDAMLRDHPKLRTLEMIEAPGTRHDIANLKVGRKIREAGMRTHVPAGGSVRSGAVELFLAGTSRTMDDSAQFAVHSWLDDYGREPGDFPEEHPANRLYLDYYVEMGMSEDRAREFYGMTNSVPHSSALWLDASDMRRWVSEPGRPAPARRMFAQDRLSLPVLVSAEGPLILPEPTVDLAMASVPFVAPSISYANMMPVSVARTDLTLLDSGRAFP